MRSVLTAILVAAFLGPCIAAAQSTTPAPAAPAASAGSSGKGTQAQKAEQDALQPAVDTSVTPAAPPADSSATSAPQPPGPKSDANSPPAHEPNSGKAMDHLQLGTTDITGNRELPKVLYIVPWKRSDLGDLTGKPLNSLVDETLQPIDRDVFKRENRYYRAVAQKASQSGNSPAGPAADADRNGSR